jgi:hypothetical protein
VREYRFRVVVAFDPAAPRGAVLGFPERTGASCVIQPEQRVYFPAVISYDAKPPPRLGANAVLSISLNNGEAAAFFAAGQRFIIWADVMVGHTVWGDGLVGYGVIACEEPPRPHGAGDHGAHGMAVPRPVDTARPSADPPQVIVVNAR